MDAVAQLFLLLAGVGLMLSLPPLLTSHLTPFSAVPHALQHRVEQGRRVAPLLALGSLGLLCVGLVLALT